VHIQFTHPIVHIQGSYIKGDRKTMHEDLKFAVVANKAGIGASSRNFRPV